MIDEGIKAIVFGEEKTFARGTTFEDIIKEYKDKFEIPIVVAREKGIYKELSELVEGGSEIEFFDLMSGEGNRIYLNGLIYLLIYSIRELYGKKTKVFVRYSIDKGLYITVDKKLTKDMIKEIKNKMLEVSEQDIKITPRNVSRLEAIDYFEKNGDTDKSSMLKYNTNSYITLYQLGHMYDFYFSKMPTSTGVLNRFNIEYLNEEGLVLMFPHRYSNGEVSKYHHIPQRFDVYHEYQDWVRIMNITNAADLNDIVSQGKMGNLIRLDETIQASRLLNIAREIHSHKDRLKIILIAGPSSSGKTTTSIKLTNYLTSFGINPVQISMDDYFVSRKKTPKKKDGTYDYECLEAVNVELFNENVDKLLNGEEIVAPVYNFLTGEPEYKLPMKLGKNDVLVIEGIHALNPAILSNIPRSKKYKMYISPMTGISIDNHNRISTSDNRLLRRIIRDNRTRGHKVEKTLASWKDVREGEEKYIFPYQSEANVTFNTALIYELGILKTYAEPLLYSVDPKSEYYNEAKRLINLLKTFLPMPSEDIPDDSLLREFIGGSCFKVT
ncbi:MAG: nucleoside kinase [Firmicutes bacterium]|nr:nucleoside kinase [Bacillota bacterium]